MKDLRVNLKLDDLVLPQCEAVQHTTSACCSNALETLGVVTGGGVRRQVQMDRHGM